MEQECLLSGGPAWAGCIQEHGWNTACFRRYLSLLEGGLHTGRRCSRLPTPEYPPA